MTSSIEISRDELSKLREIGLKIEELTNIYEEHVTDDHNIPGIIEQLTSVVLKQIRADLTNFYSELRSKAPKEWYGEIIEE